MLVREYDNLCSDVSLDLPSLSANLFEVMANADSEEPGQILSFDKNVDWDKRFAPGEPLSLGRRSSAGKSHEHVSSPADSWKH